MLKSLPERQMAFRVKLVESVDVVRTSGRAQLPHFAPIGQIRT
jgi:hypothetical protein